MGNLEDFARFGDKLQRELDKLDRHHDRDIPHVKRFVQKADANMTEGSMAEYLKNLRLTSRRLDDIPLSELTESDMDAHVYDLRHSEEYGQGPDPGMSEATVRNVEHAVTHFLELLDLADWAEDYQVTPQPKTTVTPEDMLDGEDIAALRDGANNMRDIALIEFLADSGARLGLAGTLRVGDVDVFDTDTPTYTPNPNASGLKGAVIQPYPIIDAKAPLRNYLRSTHPRPDRDDVALFHKIAGHGNEFDADSDGAISPETIRTQLQRAAKNGGVDKPVNPHNFRHSAVTRMRREGYDRSDVEHRVHWSVDTDMWETYEHISGEQHNSAIFEQAGFADGTEDELSKERLPCPNCTEPVPPHLDFCGKCGAAVSKKARDAEVKATESTAGEMTESNPDPVQQFLAALLFFTQRDASYLGAHD